MSRHKVTDRQWAVFAPYLERRNKSKAGRPQSVNNRQMFEGILWILGTGAPWRDLPPRFGAWQTVYKQFNKWAKSGALEELLEKLCEGHEDGFSSIDSSIVKVYKHGSAPVGGQKKRKHRQE